jgi:hypothetical protein
VFEKSCICYRARAAQRPGRRLREKIACNLSPLVFVPPADPETMLFVSGERQSGPANLALIFDCLHSEQNIPAAC